MSLSGPAPMPAVSRHFEMLDGCDYVNFVVPTWLSATVVYRDDAGNVVGYGLVRRKGDGFELTLADSPEAWRAGG
jgi:hypothetical protein